MQKEYRYKINQKTQNLVVYSDESSQWVFELVTVT